MNLSCVFVPEDSDADDSLQEAAAFEKELKTLQDASEEKSEQISQLESQLVELQLQVTQLTSESEHVRL